jgi:hypothetical protein
MALSSICTWTETHKPGARLQYCTRVRWDSVCVSEFMYKYYRVPSDSCAVLQSSSWFVCLSSCTNTTESHLTLVQYCSLAPGLCVSVHVQILLSAIWPLYSTAVQKAGARLQYCTRVRWGSVVFVHELRHTNQELDCSTVQGLDGTQ